MAYLLPKPPSSASLWEPGSTLLLSRGCTALVVNPILRPWDTKSASQERSPEEGDLYLKDNWVVLMALSLLIAELEENKTAAAETEDT